MMVILGKLARGYQALRLRQRIVTPSHYFLLTVLFVGGLEVAFAFEAWLWLGLLVMIALVGFGIVLIRTEEGERFQLIQIVLPLLAVIGMTGFLVFLPDAPERHIYFFGAGALFYWLISHGARLSYPTWNGIISLFILFLNTAVLLGLNFHLGWPQLLLAGLTAGVVFLIGWQAMFRLTRSLKQSAFMALALALAISELVWIMQFLPVHFLIQAGFATTAYYLFFYLTDQALAHRLSRRDLVEYGLVGAAALVILISSARWI